MNQTLQNFTSFSSPTPGIFSSVSTDSEICRNSTLVRQCDTLTIGNYTIIAPMLIPCCLGALIIGMTLAKKTIGMKTTNSLFYAMTFAMVGCMMTDAALYDCILPNLFKKNKLIHMFYGVIDVGLTSTIGYAFLILGLLDAGILSEKSKLTWGIFGVGTFGIFYGWIQTFLGNWKAGFLVLYLGVVAIGCGAWTIIQLVLVLGSKDWRSLKWLIFAGSHGGFGLYSILDRRLQIWICENIGCHFSQSFIWFLVTDTAIYFIYRFYVSRVDFANKAKSPAYVEPETEAEVDSFVYTRIN